MTASFPLTLDTHAPHVTWGAPTGTQPGEVLHVPYTLDEPEILSATITLPDGRELPMTVGTSELTVTVPLDNAAGDAEVAAVVRDDVWNQATARMTVRLEGVVLPTPSPPPTELSIGVGAPPDRQRGRTRHLVEFRSEARASSTRKIRIQDHVRRTAVARSSRTIERRPAHRPAPPPAPRPSGPVTLRRHATAHARTGRIISVRASRRSAATATSVRVIRRRDDELAALVVLDVL